MRRFFLLFCVALLLGALLFHLVQLDSGYVLISLNNTSVEMSFPTAAAVLLLIFVSIWLFLKFIVGVWRLPKSTLGGYHLLTRGASQIVYGHSRGGQNRTSRGLIDFMEGNWKQAKKQLLKSVKQSETPLINYLAAARCASEMSEQKEALALLHKAEQCSQKSEFSVALTQARMQFSNKKYEQCVATLERAKKESPKHPVVLDLLKQCYTVLRDWQALKVLIPELRRQKNYTAEELDTVENEIYSALIRDTGEQAKRLPGKEGLQQLEKAWLSVPPHLQKSPSIVETYIYPLIQQGGSAAADSLLRRTLSRNWSENLVRLYGLVETEDQQKQLLTAEGWLKERPGNAVLMLTLGRLSLRNKLWGKARDYFESSLRLQPNPETFAELARLLAHLGEHEKSTAYYQKGLMMMTHGLPELPMPQAKALGSSAIASIS